MSTVKTQIVTAVNDAESIVADIQAGKAIRHIAVTPFADELDEQHQYSSLWDIHGSDEIYYDNARQLGIQYIPQASRGSRAD
ncbi:MAG: hypothetical protein WAU16_14600 [Rhizobiaceae bacterium]